MTGTGALVLDGLFGVGELARRRRAQSVQVRYLPERLKARIAEQLQGGYRTSTRLVAAVYPLVHVDDAVWWWPEQGRQAGLRVVESGYHLSRMVAYQLTHQFAHPVPGAAPAGSGSLLVPGAIAEELRAIRPGLVQLGEALEADLSHLAHNTPDGYIALSEQTEDVLTVLARLQRIVEEVRR
ncbi:hypothetical protein [Myceligenerans xiligouense]|uniref:Uncharacterized protein n=1 Tax=Myceligenerans xiligouense TaxID=253184 RepID=A0A3N4YT98_9MICO|nr:hypothetical protein [Myceligenerans xiligouense]RPF23427.1 hypothetical protein EDD34_4114 [Myceligenerans xiligouense]